jgi:hypothetical protein
LVICREIYCKIADTIRVDLENNKLVSSLHVQVDSEPPSVLIQLHT